jgi:glyoxylase-like metal-dependent hydrolase (beta-lactamase superfamily II)
VHSPPVRRAHVTVAARFETTPSEVWSRFVDFSDAHVGPGGWSEVLVPDESRWVRRAAADLGVVEERRGNSVDGVLAYRARVPGGSALDDLDAVVRVSQDGHGSLVTWSTEGLARRSAADREQVGRWLAERLQSAGGRVLPPLTMDVWLGSSRPIARTGLDGTGPATWSPTTATLITGERDAVLVDALMTVDEADDLVAWIRGTGKRLRAVVVTQGQADHFFGLGQVLRAFPGAVATAVAGVAEQAQVHTRPALRSRWETLFPGRLPPTVTAPTPAPAGAIDLEGHALQLFDLGEVGGRPTSVVSVRDLDTLVGGDLVYNRVHPWLVGTDPASRRRWWRSLDVVEALRPSWLVAGHRHPEAVSDAAGPQVADLRRYLEDVDVVLGMSADPTSFVATMTDRWPDHGNRSTLEASAVALFAPARTIVPTQFPDLLPGGPTQAGGDEDALD